MSVEDSKEAHRRQTRRAAMQLRRSAGGHTKALVRDGFQCGIHLRLDLRRSLAMALSEIDTLTALSDRPLVTS